MKQLLLLITLFFSYSFGIAQEGEMIVDFESYDTGDLGYLNNPADGVFTTEDITLPTDYNADFMSWQGWAISSTTDTQTPGLSNQYSSMSGGGHNGSSNYAVSYVFGGATKIFRPANSEQIILNGFHINNNAFAYYSMLNGDDFAKKFGGETGDDPDFFLLTVTGFANGVALEETVDFYLADFRFDDNSMDYIVTEWTFVDLTVLSAADELSFQLTSSDNSEFGMNTPGYFCLDDYSITFLVNAEDTQLDWAVNMSPNPASDRINLEWPVASNGEYVIFNVQGQRVQLGQLQQGSNQLDIQQLMSGTYTIRYTDGQAWSVSRFVKL